MFIILIITVTTQGDTIIILYYIILMKYSLNMGSKIKISQKVKDNDGKIRTLSKTFVCENMAREYESVWKRIILAVVKDNYTNEEISKSDCIIDLTNIGKTFEQFKNTMPF